MTPFPSRVEGDFVATNCRGHPRLTVATGGPTAQKLIPAAVQAADSCAVVDLRTPEGVARAQAQWRYSDIQIQEIAHRDVGPDLKASGQPNRTFDFTPDARAADFDDSKWQIIPADSLENRRGHGRLSFNWYRTSVVSRK